MATFAIFTIEYAFNHKDCNNFIEEGCEFLIQGNWLKLRHLFIGMTSIIQEEIKFRQKDVCSSRKAFGRTLAALI